MRRLLVLAAAAAVCAVAASAAAPAAPALEMSAIGRTPFPQRAYVVDLPRAGSLSGRDVRVTEDGVRVAQVTFRPLAGSGVRYGVVLALDASDSMAGQPFVSAVDAARTFVANRAAGERIATLAFNGGIHVLRPPTLDGDALEASLSHPPALSYGTRIVDAVDASLRLLAKTKVSAGAVVLLSDGADVGSRSSLDRVLARARAQHVRVFTVALRSGALDASLLQRIARESGGTYAETAAAAELKPIYSALGQRLASEYVVQYRSAARPTSHVDVEISIAGAGSAHASYTAPAPSGLQPFHRSIASRFLLSWISLFLLCVLVAGLVGWTLHVVIERSRPRLVERIHAFVPGAAEPAAPVKRRQAPRAAAVGSQRARGWLAKLEQDLEIARIDVPAGRVVVGTALATLTVAVIMFAISPLLCLLAVLVPLTGRAVIAHKLSGVRNEFAEQLPPNLQVLASALRAGHSFLGAFVSAVENAHEPSRSELGRVVTDERLGVPVDEAIRRVAARMESRDLEQVALLAELARTTGGNSAEVLDTVVQTIRERADVRRIVRTLTAQGRMARWILTGLPIVTALGFYVIQPTVMSPLLHSLFGQVLLLVAAFMVATGSLVIQRIVDIEI